MHLSRTRAAVGLAAVGVIAASSVATAAPHHGGPAGPTTPTARAIFYRGLLGESTFVQGSGQIAISGRYTHLIPGNSYFTVIYANGNCDPAQAFPVGPFTADANGNAALDTTVPTAVLVSGTKSMSVRRADTQYDEDGDGKTGPTDVVAVPGQPSIGLVECDATPQVTGVS
jgi:hypothetical protein